MFPGGMNLTVVQVHGGMDLTVLQVHGGLVLWSARAQSANVTSRCTIGMISSGMNLMVLQLHSGSVLWSSAWLLGKHHDKQPVLMLGQDPVVGNMLS